MKCEAPDLMLPVLENMQKIIFDFKKYLYKLFYEKNSLIDVVLKEDGLRPESVTKHTGWTFHHSP